LLEGSQIKAQYFAPEVVYKAQVGVAVSPAGISDGHLLPEVHYGEQKSPATPVIYTASSSDLHPFGTGSS
jgi:hypothetical protein